MRRKVINFIKKNKIIRKIYFKLIEKIPFIENMLSLYRYSKWINNYKASINDNEFFYNKFNDLNKEVLKIKAQKGSIKKPIIIMTTYNDHDIIEAIIKKNDELGYEQIIIDNWSNDGTWSIIEKLKKNLSSIIETYQFPFDGPTESYQWKAMLDFKTNIALKYKGRWILHQDSDEITITPFYNAEIKNILEAVSHMGYNVVPLRMIDFTPIDDTFTIGDPVKHFEYYRLSPIISYGLQNKIWLQGDEIVDLSSMGGHDVNFLGKKVFPIRLPRFHYSIRSIAHAKSKYSPKRLERSASERETLGWHTHIELKISEKVIYDKDELVKYNFDDFYSEYFNWFVYND